MTSGRRLGGLDEVISDTSGKPRPKWRTMLEANAEIGRLLETPLNPGQILPVDVAGSIDLDEDIQVAVGTRGASDARAEQGEARHALGLDLGLVRLYAGDDLVTGHAGKVVRTALCVNRMGPWGGATPPAELRRAVQPTDELLGNKALIAQRNEFATLDIPWIKHANLASDGGP
jgi:hypothetical protein